MTLKIAPVRSRGQRNAWLNLPWEINEGDACWVPPLRHDQKLRAGFGHHPVWDDAERELWLATRNGKPVGRIAAIQNHAHNRRYKDQVGFFGFFESMEDAEVTAGLLEHAEAWLADRGLTSCRGPMSPTINYELGILVEGFDTPPYFLLTHNPAYYGPLIESAGYAKAQDMYAYRADISMLEKHLQNEKIAMVDRMVKERFGVSVRSLDMRNFEKEIETFLNIYNQSLVDTWGCVPMSRAEVMTFGADLKRLIVPDLARIAEVDGKPVGVMFGLLDYNDRIKAIDGRLFPLGFLKLLGNKRGIDRIRLVSTNVLPEYQSWGVGICVARSLLQPALDHGITACEFSWILETNDLSRKTVEKGGGEHYKTWRVYEKPFATG